MLYSAYQAVQDSVSPWQNAAEWASGWMDFGLKHLPDWPGAALVQGAAAANEVFARLKLTHQRPPFGITQVALATETGALGGVAAPGGAVVAVEEQTVQTRPFGSLLRFARADVLAGTVTLPKVLIVAPLSGHFATLLADTARTMLADHDVYITDWHNGRMVPLTEGPFGLAEYVEHVIGFVEALGPHTHLVAVCQPCVPVLAAVALMAQHGHIAQPRSMTLMAGPIDCRVNPTQVNKLATSQPIEWFEKNLVHTVPWRHPGGGRRVYPGFLQLTAFVGMNPDRHKQAFVNLYKQRLAGEHEAADATATFYDEYFAVNDLPAEFYLETVAHVFQQYTLAKGELMIRGEKVDTRAIRRTALFTVEGERDDICGIGQTVAAQDMCSGIKPYMKSHHVQLGVGHYGVFSGRRWRQQIYPRVREMIHMMNG